MAGLSKAIPYQPAHDGTFAGLKACQAAAGVDLSLIAPIATKPHQNETINRWAASVRCEGINCLGTIHPRTENYREIIALIKELGLVGVKFHPEYQDCNIDDESVYPIYEAVADAGLPMLFHTGADIAYAPPFKASPERTARMMSHFPGAVFVAAHLGGNWMYDEAMEKLSGMKNVYVDLAATCLEATGDKLKNYIHGYGCDKVLFATDSPWSPPDYAIKVLNEAGLAQEELEKVFHENAEKVFSV